MQKKIIPILIERNQGKQDQQLDHLKLESFFLVAVHICVHIGENKCEEHKCVCNYYGECIMRIIALFALVGVSCKDVLLSYHLISCHLMSRQLTFTASSPFVTLIDSNSALFQAIAWCTWSRSCKCRNFCFSMLMTVSLSLCIHTSLGLQWKNNDENVNHQFQFHNLMITGIVMVITSIVVGTRIAVKEQQWECQSAMATKTTAQYNS